MLCFHEGTLEFITTVNLVGKAYVNIVQLNVGVFLFSEWVVLKPIFYSNSFVALDKQCFGSLPF